MIQYLCFFQIIKEVLVKILSRDTRNEGEMMVIRYVVHGASGENIMQWPNPHLQMWRESFHLKLGDIFPERFILFNLWRNSLWNVSRMRSYLVVSLHILSLPGLYRTSNDQVNPETLIVLIQLGDRRPQLGQMTELESVLAPLNSID